MDSTFYSCLLNRFHFLPNNGLHNLQSIIMDNLQFAKDTLEITNTYVEILRNTIFLLEMEKKIKDMGLQTPAPPSLEPRIQQIINFRFGMDMATLHAIENNPKVKATLSPEGQQFFTWMRGEVDKMMLGYKNENLFKIKPSDN